ncbi:M56 family metallopeptidase [Seonamhaeicola aphaedonensis]|uniref:Beta-lactamase regulating signal transducer with metallopeptidase domain n=1 Tax=Seonamhaeicola aphaedonensis TaxID=1461338 RepID=A0A3D9H8A0_9FLAO|nr:M56 family metallopeptidase [Seonamhaeicola aphaedonensis]RED45708.1 beta-lactamase regulating signal transducer with metallopeptidase domain [Seonamhaeicola aphaedonensis]
MFQYILQTVAFQLLFLIIYDLFLRKETFFNWNRLYLLGTPILSFLIPLIKIEQFKDVVSAEYIIRLPEVFIGNPISNDNVSVQLDAAVINQNVFNIWELIFFTGVSIAVVLFGFKLYKMLKVLAKNPKQKIENFSIVNLLNSTAAFSFFKYIFLGELLSAEDKNSILKHEMVHAKQYHSADLLLFEVLRILCWFNPLIYKYQNRIVELHEFIADAQAVKLQDKKAYYENLLSQVFDTKKISFINPFFKQSLIKKRIVMLQKSKSKQINLLKYALLIPLILVMLVYTSCKKVENEFSEQDSMGSLISQLHLQLEKKGELSNEEREALMPLYNSLIRKGLNIGNFEEFMKMTSTSPKWETHFLSENKPNQIGFNQKGEKEYPFSIIEQPPVFPECEQLDIIYQKRCMAKKISEFIHKNFNTDLVKGTDLEGRQRISVIFKIDKEGKVTGVRSRAISPLLEAEANRVVNLLPKMIPGKMNGENVVVRYSLPIIFEVADDKPADKD